MFQLPNSFRWATMTAPELAARVASASAIERAQYALLAKRVILAGRTGSGKTSLAVAIGRAIMHGRDVNGMFVTAMALDRARREHRLGHGDAELVQRAFDVPVLVLDELGAEDGASGTLKELLHERHAASRQTIIACVLTGQALRRHYDGGIIRRLFTGALPIACDAVEQPPPKGEVMRIALRKPWREPVAESAEADPIPMPPDVAAALERAFASFGAPPACEPIPSLGPVDVDADAVAEAHVRNREQAAALLAAQEKTA